MSLIVDEAIAALRNFATSELQQRYAELWDDEPRSRNRRYLKSVGHSWSDSCSSASFCCAASSDGET